MKIRRASIATAVPLLGLALLGWCTAGPPAPTPNRIGTFSFAALGDAPYYPHEDLQYRLILKTLEQHDLDFVLHIGDLFGSPCSEARYRRSLRWF